MTRQLPINTTPPEPSDYVGDNITPEFSRWLGRVAQAGDVYERGALADAVSAIYRAGSEADPISSIYDDRIPDEIQNFVLDLAARVRA